MSDFKPPVELIEQYILQYVGHPKRYVDGSWTGSCPICKEGKHWNTKRRFYFNPTKGRGGDGMMYCQNCCRGWSPFGWLLQVSGKLPGDIIREASTYDYCSVALPYEINSVRSTPRKIVEQAILPENSIDLGDPIQVRYFSDNAAVQEAIRVIHHRRLDTAVNSYNYYISLTDYVHKNRLCIPFIDTFGRTMFFQTRELFPREDGKGCKYLSKANSEKTVFGINKVSVDIPFLFVTEGPIDSSFVRNGVSMAGLVMTGMQRKELAQFLDMELIWILDNEFDKPDVLEKYEDLIADGERVFIWPTAFGGFKDINDVCIAKGIDEIPNELFVKHSYRGYEATLKLKERAK